MYIYIYTHMTSKFFRAASHNDGKKEPGTMGVKRGRWEAGQSFAIRKPSHTADWSEAQRRRSLPRPGWGFLHVEEPINNEVGTIQLILV